jgi:hypothetical protein
MQTFTVEVTNKGALKTLHEMEAKHLIKIIDDSIPSMPDTPAIPGAPLELEAFKKWIDGAEIAATVDLTEAKLQWAKKRKQPRTLGRGTTGRKRHFAPDRMIRSGRNRATDGCLIFEV